jgi:hypothetical protein
METRKPDEDADFSQSRNDRYSVKQIAELLWRRSRRSDELLVLITLLSTRQQGTVLITSETRSITSVASLVSLTREDRPNDLIKVVTVRSQRRAHPFEDVAQFGWIVHVLEHQPVPLEQLEDSVGPRRDRQCASDRREPY